MVAKTAPALAEWRVFMADCDGVIRMFDDDSHTKYFPSMEVAQRTIPILQKIFQLLDRDKCDFQAWFIVSADGIVTDSGNINWMDNAAQKAWNHYLKQVEMGCA